MHKKSRSQYQLAVLYGVSFLYAAHLALGSYINSSFLVEGKGLGENVIGILFTLGSLVAILELIRAPRWYERFGNRTILVALSGIHILSVIGFLSSTNPYLIGLFFVSYLAANSLMFYALDVSLEHHTNDTSTGNTRGLYLTITNAAWVLFPFIGGLILGNTTTRAPFNILYISGIVLLLVMVLLIITKVKNYQPSPRIHKPFLSTVRAFWHKRALRQVFCTHAILHFFFSIMVIYTPIYLTAHIGLSWGILAWVFLIMLLPFVILEYPLGRLADRALGEKEILIAGFLIMALATISISFITSSNWLIWSLVLFITRVGASAVEVMSETYFYKNITEKQSDYISVFRDARPLSYMFGPLIATGLLSIFGFPLQYLFVALGIIVAIGAIVASRMHDTK